MASLVTILLLKFAPKTFIDKLEMGHVVVQLVEALRYKPEGHGFDSWWCHWNFSFSNPSGHTMARG
jgi:hypothetical protein